MDANPDLKPVARKVRLFNFKFKFEFEFENLGL